MDEIEKAYILHARDVYRYLLSLSHDDDLAEDLTQETFFRAMKTIGNYDGSCKLSVWLCQIAKHLWYQWLDKQKRQKRGDLDESLQSGESIEVPNILHADKTTLYRAIQSLPEAMRDLVHMRLTGEFTFGEIGEILGKSENWARTTFYRAKIKIIEKMEDFT